MPRRRLLSDLEGLDWGDSIKEMQRNWIGRSEGATVRFEVVPGAAAAAGAAAASPLLEVYTTRPDTLFGATYLVVAPEHPMLTALAAASGDAAVAGAVAAYAAAAAKKSDLERTELAKQKSGVFTGGWIDGCVFGAKGGLMRAN